MTARDDDPNDAELAQIVAAVLEPPPAAPVTSIRAERMMARDDDPDDAELAPIVAAVLGPRAAAAERLAGGTRSAAYRLDGAVVRFSRRRTAAQRFANERAALAVVAAASSVVCPAVLSWGHSGDWSWQITSSLAGPPVAALWPSATAAERRRFVDLAAEALIALHGIAPAAFGDLVGPAYASAGALLAARLAEARQAATASCRFTAGEFDGLAGRVQALAAALPPAAPELRHGDFHFGNLLATGRGLAVIDLEWAGGGRGLDDLAIADYQDELCPGSAAPLAAAYRARAGIDREVFHQLLHAARFTWKLVQSATRRSANKAATNKAELTTASAAVAGCR